MCTMYSIDDDMIRGSLLAQSHVSEHARCEGRQHDFVVFMREWLEWRNDRGKNAVRDSTRLLCVLKVAA